MYNKSKFVFSETFNNSTGKTSGSGFIGVLLGMIAAASFIGAMVGYYLQIPNTIEVMGAILKLTTAATILLGVRKISGQLINKKDVIVEPIEPIEPIEPTDVEEKG